MQDDVQEELLGRIAGLGLQRAGQGGSNGKSLLAGGSRRWDGGVYQDFGGLGVRILI